MGGMNKFQMRIRSLNMQAKIAIAACPVPTLRLMGSMHQLLSLGKFVRSAGLRACSYFPSRYDLYEHLHQEIVGDVPIDYLEFGVYTGNSMRKWVSINKHPASTFVGFDTFEGLPEPWEFAVGGLGAGYFSTNGQTPDIPDPRVRFIKGLFQDTLRGFACKFRPRNRLVLHCDADLYTSTLYILTTLHDFLKPGTIVVFDEFGTVNQEFRAFMDYTLSFRIKLVPVAWAGGFYEQVAFVVTGS
jgi:O-methyltransferase